MRKRMMNETASDKEVRLKKEAREIAAKGIVLQPAVPFEQPKVKKEKVIEKIKKVKTRKRGDR